jgi:hypothetical protein
MPRSGRIELAIIGRPDPSPEAHEAQGDERAGIAH